MTKAAQQYAAFAFGVLFVVFLIVLAINFPNPTSFQYIVFRTVLALAAAGVAAMIPGFLTLRLSRWLRAGGALAVFAVVYFYDPALRLHEVLVPPLEARVTVEAGKYDAQELLGLLSQTTGGVVVDPALLERLNHKSVTLAASLRDVSLKATLDLVFRQLDVDAEYSTEHNTVSVRERRVSQ